MDALIIWWGTPTMLQIVLGILIITREVWTGGRKWKP
jgi:hypothetical protein